MTPAFWHLALSLLPLALAAKTYRNPVLGGDVPDPGVLWAPEISLYVAATTGCDAAGCFALHTSPDLATWAPAGYLFPAGTFPAWASSAVGLTAWAPEIHRLASGAYVAVYVSRDGRVDRANGPLCIGAASSAHALGPWQATAAPLVTRPPGACWGVIDPTVFVPPGGATSPTLVFKTDGNFCGEVTSIVSVPLTADGLNVTAGAPWRTLLQNDAAWEGPLVEAPWVVHNASSGYYYLFFSGSVYDKASYAIGVARSRALEGPYEKAPLNPILHSSGASGVNYGPGHCAVVAAGGASPHGLAILYAAEQPPSGPQRNLMLDAIVWSADGWPGVAGGVPSTSTLPIPQ